MQAKRVVVTGYGAVSALGENVPEIWDAIMQYRVGYKAVEFPDPKINARFFSFMEEKRQRYAGFPKAVLKMLPTFAKNALVASREALTMAFGASDDIHRHLQSPFDIGAVIGTGWGGMDAVNDNNNDYRESGLASSFATLMSMHSIGTAAVALNWNLRGYQNTPVAACATGTIAIGDAYEVIKSGRAKVMLAGGSESLKEVFNVWSIDVIQALSKEQHDVRRACCPFSARRSGFVLAEGAAVLCLEEREHALARGATIYAELAGFGTNSDGTHVTQPNAATMKVAMELALRDAGLAPEAIGYVNAHGTATQQGDLAESRATAELFGKRMPISSLKSYMGHTLGACGALEAWISIQMMREGWFAPTINLDDVDPECGELDYIRGEGRRIDCDYVMSNNFAFGGINTSLIFKKSV
jgi:3-oxoacyl-[acyl-carrier-protein] synthase II